MNGSVVTGVNNAAQPKNLTAYNLNFQNFSSPQTSEFLTTNQPLGCPTCYNPEYLRGQDPTNGSVPVRVWGMIDRKRRMLNLGIRENVCIPSTRAHGSSSTYTYACVLVLAWVCQDMRACLRACMLVL